MKPQKVRSLGVWIVALVMATTFLTLAFVGMCAVAQLAGCEINPWPAWAIHCPDR